MVKVIVQKDNLEKALRQLKKKTIKEGIMRTLRNKRYYEKPSDKRVRKNKEMRANHLKKKRLERKFK